MNTARNVKAAGGATSRGPTHSLLLLSLCLAGFLAVAYGQALSIPFIGDDYVFLDKTRSASFADLWSFQNTNFGWYRPWSRELHFWFLGRQCGLNEVGFRAASMLIWLVGLSVYGSVLLQVTSRRSAMVAMVGAASLALWGSPLIWISGSQDLWMILFALLTLLLYMRGRRGLAILPFALALLSKETSAVVPGILFGYELFVRRSKALDAARSILPFAAIVIGWFWLHPVLSSRLFSPGTVAVPIGPPVDPLRILWRTGLSTLNLDRLLPAPDPTAFSLWQTVGSSVVLGLGALLACAETESRRASREKPTGRMRAVAFGAVWAAAGWAPLLMPSIEWHAYYGCLGALGAWLAIASLLDGRGRAFVVSLIVALGVLRGMSAATPSWDWGSEWYQRRAGNMLSLIRSQLLAQYPALPHGSRVYFGSIPNNIGLVAGESPAIRVWYADSTLEAGFYSYYRARRHGETDGRDLFFHFDSTYGLREVRTGPEDVASAVAADGTWERNHESLAMLLLGKGDSRLAAAQFEKLAELPHRPDALVFAGVSWLMAGDSLRADSIFVQAAHRLGAPRADIDEWVGRLLKAAPRG